jgi:hypothetical protein
VSGGRRVQNRGPDGTVCCLSAAGNKKVDRYRFYYPAEHEDGGRGTCKQIPFDFVPQVVNWVHTVSSAKYEDDPAVMSGKVMNEPRIGLWQPDKSAEVIRYSRQEAGKYRTRIDKNIRVLV